MAAEVSTEALESFKAYKRNLQWARAHGENLEKYKGMFVAVANGKVLDSAQKLGELQEKYAEVPGVYVTLVVQRGLKWVL